MSRLLKDEKGFTLVELLISITVVLLLTGIAIPVYMLVMDDMEDDIDRAMKQNIEAGANAAASRDEPYDEPVDKAYRVGTLIDEGYLDAVDGVDRDAWIAHNGEKFEYTGVKEVTNPDDFTYAPVTEADKSYYSGLMNHKDDINGTMKITGYNGNDTVLVLPKEYNGTQITMADEGLFEENHNITAVYLPEGFKLVNQRMFQAARNLEKIYLPDSITAITVGSLSRASLTQVTLPDSLKHIGVESFRDNQLTEIALPEGLAVLHNGVFANNKIETVRLPRGLRIIGETVFFNNKIRHVNIPDGVTSIGAYAFERNEIESVVIPDTVKHVYVKAFYNNNIKNVKLSAKTEQYWKQSFANNRIERIELSGSSTNNVAFGAQSFADNNIKELKLAPDVNIRQIWDRAFENNELTHVKLPEPLNKVGSYYTYAILSNAFNNNQIEEIELPKGRVVLHTGVFANNNLGVVYNANSNKVMSGGSAIWTGNPDVRLESGIKRGDTQ